MNPHDFLDLAGEWAAGSREAEWRSAVSRAYYAAFHVAREFFRDHGFTVPRADRAHAYLWMRLANAGQVEVEEIGQHLSYLRSARNRADYDLDRPLLHAEAFGHVQLADDIIQTLGFLRNTPAVLAAVVDAIRLYERDVLREVTFCP